jgi:hypothetical protein
MVKHTLVFKQKFQDIETKLLDKQADYHRALRSLNPAPPH